MGPADAGAIAGKGKRATREGGRVVLEYLDTVTGHAPGVPDPGGNLVVGSDPGSGERALAITLLLWEALRKAGIPVIEAERLDTRRVRVDEVELIPLEVIVRNRATGSFLRRYGRFAREGTALEGLIELTLKDDALGDPLIVDEAVRLLGLASADELAEMRRLAQEVNAVLNGLFAGTDVEVWDFKVEFGRYGAGIVLRDELSPRTARFRTEEGAPVPDEVVLATVRRRAAG